MYWNLYRERHSMMAYTGLPLSPFKMVVKYNFECQHIKQL